MSPDGARAVTSGGNPTTAILWDAREGTILASLEQPSAFSVHRFCFSPDGSSLFGVKNRESVVAWDGRTGRFTREWTAGESPLMAVDFGADGKTLLAAHRDKSLVLWDLDSRQPRKQFPAPAEEPTAVALSADGRSALTGDDKGRLILWSVETGAPVRDFAGHEGRITCVAFHPQGKGILSGSLDTTVRLWDPETGKSLRSFDPHPWKVGSVGFSPDGTVVAAAFLDGTVRTWTAADGRALASFPGLLTVGQSVPFSTDGREILTMSTRTLAWTDARSGERRRKVPGHEGAVTTVAWTSDGRRLLTGSEDGTAVLWEVASSRLVRTFESHRGPINALALLPDGRSFLTASADRTLILWNLETGARRHTLRGEQSFLSTLAVAPDGRHALTGGADDVVLWDLGSEKQVEPWERSFDSPAAVAFRGSEQMFLQRTDGSVVRRFVREPGSTEVLPKGDKALTSCDTGLDGLRSVRVFNDRFLAFWDAERGEARDLATLEKTVVRSVALSPDGEWIAVGSADGRIGVWEVGSGKRVEELAGPECAVRSLAFSPGGRRLASGSDDTTVLVWEPGSRREEVRGWLDEWTRAAGPKRGVLLEKPLADLRSAEWTLWTAAADRLLALGDAAVEPILRESLPKSTSELGDAPFSDIVRRLDADAPEERSRAAEELVAFGRQALPRITRALVGSGLAVETRGRLEAVRSRLDRSLVRGDLGRLRAVLLLLELPRTQAVRRALGRFAFCPGNTWAEELALRTLSIP